MGPKAQCYSVLLTLSRSTFWPRKRVAQVPGADDECNRDVSPFDLAILGAENHQEFQLSSFTRILHVALLHLQSFGRMAELRSAIMAFYTRTHEEHWLRDKLEEGRTLILDDESIWEVHPSDREMAQRWLRISTIT